MANLGIKDFFESNNRIYHPNIDYSLDDNIIDNKQLKNIDTASWFKTMEHYPKTVGHMKLLVSIVDKIGIFNKFDLSKTSNMDANKLNILYAILRIMNKVFNKYLDYVVKIIFRENLKNIFVCSHLTYYDLFFDQLTQDIDHFICLIIKSYYPKMKVSIIKNKLVDYLQITFGKPFYTNIMKKLNYNIDNGFYKENNTLFISIVQEFIKYTKETLLETYETMKIFLTKIFDDYCSIETMNEIITSLKKHIDLKNLFMEPCMEIDIYCEQKLYDEYERNNMDYNNYMFVKKNNQLNIKLSYIGYQIFNEYPRESSMGILYPFVEHNFVKNEKDMLNILLNVMISYRKEPQLMDINSNITLEDYYALTMAMKYPHFPSYEEYCNLIATTKQLPDLYPLDFLLRLISRIYGVKIELFREDLTMIEIDNAIINHINEPVILYCHKPTLYYNLYQIDQKFTPIFDYPKSIDDIIYNFNKFVKSFKNKNSYNSILLC